MARVKRDAERKNAPPGPRKVPPGVWTTKPRKKPSHRSAFYKHLRVRRVQRASCNPLIPLAPFRKLVRNSLPLFYEDTRYTIGALKLQRLLVESTVHEILKDAAWATTFVAERAVMPQWLLASCFRRWTLRPDVNCCTGAREEESLINAIDKAIANHIKPKGRDERLRIAMLPL